jgi:hypothetical protein
LVLELGGELDGLGDLALADERLALEADEAGAVLGVVEELRAVDPGVRVLARLQELACFVLDVKQLYTFTITKLDSVTVFMS